MQAVNIYTTDNGKLPPSIQGRWNPRDHKEVTWWTVPNRIKYYYGDPTGLNGGSLIDVLGDYMESAENFNCPATNASTEWQDAFIGRSSDDSVGLLDSSFYFLWNFMKYSSASSGYQPGYKAFNPTDNGDTLMVMDFFMASEQYNTAAYGLSWLTTHKFRGSSAKTFMGADSLYPTEDRIPLYVGPRTDIALLPDVELNVGYLDGRVERAQYGE